MSKEKLPENPEVEVNSLSPIPQVIKENKPTWRSKPRKRRLTKKQSTYVQHLLDGVPSTQAVRESGYVTKNPHAIGYQNLQNESILSVLTKSIQEGRYDILVEKTWQDCLNDEGNQSVKVGERMDTHRTKLKAVEQIAKIGGLIAPVKHETHTLSADITSLLPKGSVAK